MRKMDVRRGLVVAAFMCCAVHVAGCSPATTHVVVNNAVIVAVLDGPNAGKVPGGVDLSDKRIAVALNAIEKHLGEPLHFEVDSTLIPKFKDGLHEAFVEALETLVTSLDYVARDRPEHLAFVGPRLRTVRWVYNPSRRNAMDVELDVEKKRVEVPVAADAHRLLEDSLITTVFARAWSNEKERRYAHAAPSTIPPTEHEYYLEYVRSYRPASSNATKLEREKAEIEGLGRLLAFYPHLVDEKLLKEARGALVYGGRKLQRWYADLEESPGLQPSLGRTHAQWIKWLNQEHTRLSDVQQRDIGTHLFTFHYEPTPGFGDGLDVLALGTPRIRSWIERSKVEQKGYGASDGANDLIVCPPRYDQRSHTFSAPNGSCNGRLYTTLAKAAPEYSALVAMLEREAWVPLTQSATLNVVRTLGTEAVVDFWEALAKHPEHAQAALVALAEYNEWGSRSQRRDKLPALSPKPFVEKIPKWWQQYPARRPQLLYLLTTLGHEYEGSVRWPKLAQYLGTRLTQEEVARFLQQSPDTIWHLRNLVHSLSDGWSRSAMMLPELERFLDEAKESGRGEPSPYYVTERCVEFLCIAGTARDLAALKTFLKERGEVHPSERRYFDSFVSQSRERVCPAHSPQVKDGDKDAAEPVVFFGD